MITVLFYRDKNWRWNDSAKNVWLNVMHDTKTFRKTVSFSYNTYPDNVIEVKRKSDIDYYTEYLLRHDYTEEE